MNIIKIINNAKHRQKQKLWKFSSYSNRNATFSIKFKNNNNERLHTQVKNEYENEMDYDNYDEE